MNCKACGHALNQYGICPICGWQDPSYGQQSSYMGSKYHTSNHTAGNRCTTNNLTTGSKCTISSNLTTDSRCTAGSLTTGSRCTTDSKCTAGSSHKVPFHQHQHRKKRKNGRSLPALADVLLFWQSELH